MKQTMMLSRSGVVAQRISSIQSNNNLVLPNSCRQYTTRTGHDASIMFFTNSHNYYSYDNRSTNSNQQQQQKCQNIISNENKRLLSTSAEATNKDDSNSNMKPVDKYEFIYPKVKDLFERITSSMTAQQADDLGQHVNHILGRTWRKNEFYHTGFAIPGKRSGSKGRGAGSGGAIDMDALASAAALAAAEIEAAKIKTYDIKLIGYDAASKIKIIKEVRAIANLGLKEAKDMVEGIPKIITKNIKPDDAELIKQKLQDLGAQIELV